MATELQADSKRDPAPRRWPKPPTGGAASRPGGPKPPPGRRPARRPDPGPAKSPPNPARPPSPNPVVEEPAASVDLSSVAVVDLRLPEIPTPELVGALVGEAGATPTEHAATDLRSSLPRLREEESDEYEAPVRMRPVPGPNDGYEAAAEQIDRDVTNEEPGSKTGRPIWPEIRFYIGSASLFFIAFALATGMWVLGPTLVMGWHSATITSGSMEPAIHVGDVVVFSQAPDAPIGRGTVIVFPDDRGSLITHRVIGTVDDGRYITRGDNNPVNDSTPVAHEDVAGVGRLLVPYAGFPAAWTSSGSVSSVLVVAVGFGFLSFASRWALLPRFSPWPVER